MVDEEDVEEQLPSDRGEQILSLFWETDRFSDWRTLWVVDTEPGKKGLWSEPNEVNPDWEQVAEGTGDTSVKAAVVQLITEGLQGESTLGYGADSIGVFPPLTRKDIEEAHLAVATDHSAGFWPYLLDKVSERTGKQYSLGTARGRTRLLKDYLDHAMG